MVGGEPTKISEDTGNTCMPKSGNHEKMTRENFHPAQEPSRASEVKVPKLQWQLPQFILFVFFFCLGTTLLRTVLQAPGGQGIRYTHWSSSWANHSSRRVCTLPDSGLLRFLGTVPSWAESKQCKDSYPCHFAWAWPSHLPYHTSAQVFSGGCSLSLLQRLTHRFKHGTGPQGSSIPTAFMMGAVKHHPPTSAPDLGQNFLFLPG